MGYYTRFDMRMIDPVTLRPPDPTPVGHALAIKQAFNSPYWGGSFSWNPDEGSINSGSSVKWYSWKEELIQVSTMTPYILRLHGVGEEQGDEWMAFAYGGSVVVLTREAWDPPVPVDKLPPLRPAAGPGSSPDPTPAERLLKSASHVDCPLTNRFLSYRSDQANVLMECTCWVKSVLEALTKVES